MEIGDSACRVAELRKPGIVYFHLCEFAYSPGIVNNIIIILQEVQLNLIPHLDFFPFLLMAIYKKRQIYSSFGVFLYSLYS